MTYAANIITQHFEKRRSIWGFPLNYPSNQNTTETLNKFYILHAKSTSSHVIHLWFASESACGSQCINSAKFYLAEFVVVCPSVLLSFWFFSFQHAGTFPTMAARSRAACSLAAAHSLIAAPELKVSSCCQPLPDFQRFSAVSDPASQLFLPLRLLSVGSARLFPAACNGLPRTAVLPACLHPVNSSRLLPAAAFPWALQAGSQQLGMGSAWSH